MPRESTQIVSESGTVSFLRSKLGSHSTALFILVSFSSYNSCSLRNTGSLRMETGQVSEMLHSVRRNS